MCRDANPRTKFILTAPCGTRHDRMRYPCYFQKIKTISRIYRPGRSPSCSPNSCERTNAFADLKDSCLSEASRMDVGRGEERRFPRLLQFNRFGLSAIIRYAAFGREATSGCGSTILMLRSHALSFSLLLSFSVNPYRSLALASLGSAKVRILQNTFFMDTRDRPFSGATKVSAFGDYSTMRWMAFPLGIIARTCTHVRACVPSRIAGKQSVRLIYRLSRSLPASSPIPNCRLPFLPAHNACVCVCVCVCVYKCSKRLEIIHTYTRAQIRQSLST